MQSEEDSGLSSGPPDLEPTAPQPVPEPGDGTTSSDQAALEELAEDGAKPGSTPETGSPTEAAAKPRKAARKARGAAVIEADGLPESQADLFVRLPRLTDELYGLAVAARASGMRLRILNTQTGVVALTLEQDGNVKARVTLSGRAVADLF